MNRIPRVYDASNTLFAARPRRAARPRFASVGQVDLIRRIAGERSLSAEHVARLEERLSAGLGRDLVDETIAWLKRQPKLGGAAPAAGRDEIPPLGVYELDGQFYAIREFTNDRSEVIRYARQAQAVNDDGEVVAVHSADAHRVDWAKAPGMQYKLGAARVLTLDEIKALSLHFSNCFVCGRKLKVNESKAKGIGPKCEAKIGR